MILNFLLSTGASVPFTPPEQDSDDDPISEQIASFLIRMDDIAMVQQAVDSLVCAYLMMRADEAEYLGFRERFRAWMCCE